MVTSNICVAKFGKPDRQMEIKHLALWDVPEAINLLLPTIPNKIYCNKLLIEPLQAAFINIIDRGLTAELKTWDGCFNIRAKKGGTSFSLHSWAIAVDINAAWNGFGAHPQISAALVKCFTDAGFDWGGTWKVKDGMHFQLKAI